MGKHTATAASGVRSLPVPPAAGTNIAQVNSTHVRLRNAAAAFLSGAALFIIIMTLTPYQGGSYSPTQTGNEGNVVNQIGYLSLGVIYLFCLFAFVDRRILANIVSPAWVIIFGIAFWWCRYSYQPDAATRGVLLTLIAMTLIAGALLLPRSERDFVNAAANALLLIVLMDYAAVVLIPNAAIHTGGGGEPWHQGSWRGHLVHKNFAAPLFSFIALFGIYCMRSGVRWRGALIFVLSFIFVLKTQSKTTTGFLPLTIMIVSMAWLTGKPWLTIATHSILAIAISCLSIGSVMSPSLLPLTRAVIEDSTFTGRDSIWIFGLERLQTHLWQGFGTYGFWGTQAVLGQEENFEAAWDVRGIVSGHNSYLDIILMFGLPAGAVVLTLLMIKPLWDYTRAYRNPANRPLADFFMMVVVLMTYVGMLESFMLNRADPMWMAFALAVFGMGMLAKRSVKP
ncbi:O-antigen ligase family protein [Pararhizobium sp.]|uniref:O-antigen ligase family protein n=1 Tax=Pararhizobium sp. TaxID=1977563 RepID=UPI002715B1F9|nr:O-antigen ligase [Pararhizobium sp.]MDO9418706.1 O-antigen ligase [Pararhizobium sp.]